LEFGFVVNYKTSAQASASACQRQAQAFWFMQYFMVSFNIHAQPTDVNGQSRRIRGKPVPSRHPSEKPA